MEFGSNRKIILGTIWLRNQGRSVPVRGRFFFIVSRDLEKRNEKLVCELIVQSIYVAFQVYPVPLGF